MNNIFVDIIEININVYLIQLVSMLGFTLNKCLFRSPFIAFSHMNVFPEPGGP